MSSPEIVTIKYNQEKSRNVPPWLGAAFTPPFCFTSASSTRIVALEVPSMIRSDSVVYMQSSVRVVLFGNYTFTSLVIEQ